MEKEDVKQVWTPLKIIQWAVPQLAQRGIQSPRLDAEILVAHALKIKRLEVYLQFDRPLDADELSAIRELLKRRFKREPVQYLTGKREFYGFPFKVAPGVLIPRPETEFLVERAVGILKELPEGNRSVLDLGTGSGCIAISLAKTLPCRVWAVDNSEESLAIARENGRDLDTDSSVQWRKGSWFSALGPADPSRFILILSNPPYIPRLEKDGLDPEVRDFEPAEALFGGEDGLSAYREIALELDQKLEAGGTALLEIHADNHDKIMAVFMEKGFLGQVSNDLQGLPRILHLCRK